MASLLKLKTDIKKLKAAIASKATSGVIKTKLRTKLTTLEKELDKLQPNKSKVKKTAPIKEVTLLKLAKKRRKNQNLSTSKSDIERDAIRPAKPSGRRTSANGNRYYEYRDNRIDTRQPPKKYRKLADGGNTSDFDNLIADKFKMQDWYENFNDGFEMLLTKKYITQQEYEKYEEILNRVDPIDKYGKMSGRAAAKKFVDDNKRYTKMADGGKTQGYDDKKDESLGMTRGKLSLKDFVGNRKQKEHARRDDARFEERGKMDHGGYMADGGAVSTRELNKKIKSWYMKTYPTDDMGKDIRDEITFKSLWNMMHQGYDVYEVLDVYDSVVRERVFEKLSQILGVDYDVVYNKWLGYADGGMMADGGSVDYKLEVINQYSDEKLARIYSHLNDYDYSEILAEIKGDPGERKNIVSKIFKEVVERDNQMADGGSVAKGNYEMLLSQAKEVMHHAEELMQVAKPDMDVEAWVVAKAERAATDLSDITHYLDGLKMAMGGMVKHNAHKVNA